MGKIKRVIVKVGTDFEIFLRRVVMYNVLLYYPFAVHMLTRLISGSFVKPITVEEAGSLISVA